MAYFIQQLLIRNPLLFYFGLANFVLACLFVLFSKRSQLRIAGANAWHKPIKFALSIGIYSWTMAWYVAYLSRPLVEQLFSASVLVFLGFEIIYIGVQAGRGQRSHFNLSSPVYALLYNLMAFAAAMISFWTAGIAILFIQADFPLLPNYYIGAIRLGLILFVIFSLQGFVMGASLSHTIGGPDGEEGLPFLNWSRKYGDPRVAHFVGMHALQVLPLLSYYVIKDLLWTYIAGALYALLAVWVLWQALKGRPLLKMPSEETLPE